MPPVGLSKKVNLFRMEELHMNKKVLGVLGIIAMVVIIWFVLSDGGEGNRISGTFVSGDATITFSGNSFTAQGLQSDLGSSLRTAPPRHRMEGTYSISGDVIELNFSEYYDDSNVGNFIMAVPFSRTDNTITINNWQFVRRN